MLKRPLKDYLNFTRLERRGIAVLCTLIILCWCFPIVFQYFRQNKQPDYSTFQQEIAGFEREQDSLKKMHDNIYERKDNYSSTGILNLNDLPDPFPFDPNTISFEGWQRLGVPVRTIHTILNYQKAGGYFFKKEDLNRIYGLSPELYQHLEPYIRIIPRGAFKNSTPNLNRDSVYTEHTKQTIFLRNKLKNELAVIDINTADSLQWIMLKGIGPVLSSRIIRFRKALGGFHKIEQIAEVYGLPDSTFQSIKQQLNISSFSLKKLNVNTATVEELKSHPYIGYRLAASIKAFREQHGAFQRVEDLQQLQLVNEQIYLKIVPYLTVQ